MTDMPTDIDAIRRLEEKQRKDREAVQRCRERKRAKITRVDNAETQTTVPIIVDPEVETDVDLLVLSCPVGDVGDLRRKKNKEAQRRCRARQRKEDEAGYMKRQCESKRKYRQSIKDKMMTDKVTDKMTGIDDGHIVDL